MDDGLLAAHIAQVVEKMNHDIRGSFEIQDLGEPSWLLGVQIIRDWLHGTIHISQPSFISTLSKQFNVPPRRSIQTPMEEKLMLKIASPEDSPAVIPYSSSIGSLNYCALFTRPDISFAANKCTQYSSKPTLEHCAAATRTLHTSFTPKTMVSPTSVMA